MTNTELTLGDGTLDSEVQYHCWSMGAEQHVAGVSAEVAQARFDGFMGSAPKENAVPGSINAAYDELKLFFETGFRGHGCPDLTAPSPE